MTEVTRAPNVRVILSKVDKNVWLNLKKLEKHRNLGMVVLNPLDFFKVWFSKYVTLSDC